jgi:beta-glucosidase-like glycosyl hydrolase
MTYTKELVKITFVDKENGRITYNSRLWSGCYISSFPENIKVGQTWEIVSDFSKIISMKLIEDID